MSGGVFLDTSVIIAALTGTSRGCVNLVFGKSLDLHTNDYVLKETYHVLRKRFGFSEWDVSGAIRQLRERTRVHRNPPVAAFRKLEIRDKADRPVVYAAMTLGCMLATLDEKTAKDACRYVKVYLPKD